MERRGKMDKEYFNNEKEKYIIKSLKRTQIPPVYWPVIKETILRRCYTFQLSDELFKRDVDSFVSNVRTINVEQLPEGTLNRFYYKERRIAVSPEWFKLENIDFRRFFDSFSHECCHAMNFIENEKGEKEDRTLADDRKSVVEVFTECQSDALVYNGPPVGLLEDSPGLRIRYTAGYPDITRYADIIAATFGVSRIELLREEIKGKEEFQNFLNEHINMTCDNSNENAIFDGISYNIQALNEARCEEDSQIAFEGIVSAHSGVFKYAEYGIDIRLSSLEIEEIEEFKKRFNDLRINQKIVELTIVFPNYHLEEEFKNRTSGIYQTVNAKMLSIAEILENDDIKEKKDLIKIVQKANSLEEIEKIMQENNISIDLNARQDLTIPIEVIKEHIENDNSIEWNNDEIVKYITENKENFLATERKKTPKMQIVKGKINEFFKGVKEFVNKILKKEQRKTLSSGTENTDEEGKSWELANYGIDKDTFIEKSAEIVQEHITKKEETTTNNKKENHIK